MGVNAKDLIPPPGGGVNYLSAEDDQLDPKIVKTLIEPHIKKFNDFGFTPTVDKKKGK